MTTQRTPQNINLLIERIKAKHDDILSWLESLESAKELPLYSSVDVRDAGFKAAVIDTNLFPAGFNNLCEHGLADSEIFLRQAIQKRLVHCQNILLIAEEHTRNTWYLENVRILEQIIQRAGFDVRIATFLNIQPDFCHRAKFVELETASGEMVRIHCFRKILDDIRQRRDTVDLIILNNDLTTGIPDVLKNSDIPIYPSIQAGWHSRHKSIHFGHTQELMKDFGRIVDMDPWLFSCLFKVMDKINVHAAEDRGVLHQKADELFKEIALKYREHQIQEKPFLFVKSDSGTYGMGVLSIEDPDEILSLNRKDRNKLHVGKSAQVIERYLLQEGVPTIYQTPNDIREVCIYQIENNLVGGFYRSHSAKTSRDNLNAQGMEFKKMCPHLNKYGNCGVHHDVSVFDVYRILARIAAIAAHREIAQLEAQASPS